MGIEYKIKFNIQSREKLEALLERILQNINIAEAEIMPEVFVKLENDGFYFCDNCGNQNISNRVFRQLIDVALSETSGNVICESL